MLSFCKSSSATSLLCLDFVLLFRHVQHLTVEKKGIRTNLAVLGIVRRSCRLLIHPLVHSFHCIVSIRNSFRKAKKERKSVISRLLVYRGMSSNIQLFFFSDWECVHFSTMFVLTSCSIFALRGFRSK